MRQRGAGAAVLWVFEQNPRARRFYERQGYALEPGRARVLEYETTRIFAVRYRKSLQLPSCLVDR